MANLNFGTSVNLKQAVNLIVACPKVRFFLEGEPGIGKTAIMETLKEKLGSDYEYAYVDVPNLDLGDICMPVIDRDTKTTTYYPNARFKVHMGKPCVILLDEFSKGNDPVKNMLHPLLNEGRLGDVQLHLDTIVVLTGNLSSDNVGDMLKGHTRNRITTLHVRKPSAEEWIEWGMVNGIDETLLAFAHQFPHAFASYTDEGQAENPYIYHPKRFQRAYFSPRSAARASQIVKARKALDQDSIIASLTGTCGESFARDFQAYLDFSDQLPNKEAVLEHPESAPVPTSPAAQSIIVFGAISWVEKDTLPKFMKYLERLPVEWQAVFAINIAKSHKHNIAFTCRAFSEWCSKHADVL
jgi:AAA domain (dynein-related subfamily)